ncbi:unnamed protein product [Trichogramma brassicae]|uniref:Uncharacterized protein n=1 Tax=Trichogramma brassicae TaxID=86971 RepID=A0A6H5IXR6_9HYME|nr:unnamed protein product [Trichogramma brassicae]
MRSCYDMRRQYETSNGCESSAEWLSASIAQLVRAPPWLGEGRGFDSHSSPNFFIHIYKIYGASWTRAPSVPYPSTEPSLRKSTSHFTGFFIQIYGNGANSRQRTKGRHFF